MNSYPNIMYFFHDGSTRLVPHYPPEKFDFVVFLGTIMILSCLVSFVC